MSALTTTLKNALLNELTVNKIVTTKALFNSVKIKHQRMIHCEIPFIMMYERLREPKMEKLSAISP